MLINLKKESFSIKIIVLYLDLHSTLKIVKSNESLQGVQRRQAAESIETGGVPRANRRSPAAQGLPLVHRLPVTSGGL